jgi:hypothetical protein
MIKHKHHIIPRHAGGTDDPDNIIELSIEEHAEAHRLLFEKYARKEDELAWKCLAGIIDKKELVKELTRLGGVKGGAKGGKAGKGRKQTPEWIEKRKLIGEKNGMFGKTLSDEHKNKLSIKSKKYVDRMGDEHQGTKNLKNSTKKRTELGMMPSQQKWTCNICGKSGIGLSNYSRWHKERCIK